MTDSEFKDFLPGVSNLPNSWCVFDARLVPFLAAAGQDIDGRCRGISVLPHPSGGIVLAATSGRVLCVARDPSGEVNKDGMSLIMPPSAIAACKAPKPMQFPDQGDVFEVPMPGWCQPHRIIAVGASLLVWPKEQPEDPGRHEEDGLPLWSGMIETGRIYREDDYRREKPFFWNRIIRDVDYECNDSPIYLGTQVMGKVADAMRASPVLFWRALQINGDMTVYLPAKAHEDGAQPELAIYTAHARTLAFEPVSEIPEWLDLLREKDADPAAAREVSNG